MSTGKTCESILAALTDDNEGRRPKLVREKFRRMETDSFAFFRGAIGLFVRDWDAIKPRDVGPQFLICGDLHLENFGAYRDDGGGFHFDINDFDEATIAPVSFDLVRCSTSILLAADNWRMRPLQASRMVLAYFEEYRATVTNAIDSPTPDVTAPGILPRGVRELLGKTAIGSQATLLEHKTAVKKNGARKIIRSKERHPRLDPGRRKEVLEAVKAYRRKQGKPLFSEPLDATRRIAGIGSLGVERYLVLVAGVGEEQSDRLFDVKEALPSAIRSCSDRPEYEGSEAARVVQAQRTLQARPASGLDVIPINGVDYRLREMIPEENRSSIERLQREPGRLRQAVTTAGRLTGLAHQRGARAESDPEKVVDALAHWADGPALDSVLAAAVRDAERTTTEFKRFLKERRDSKAPIRPSDSKMSG